MGKRKMTSDDDFHKTAVALTTAFDDATGAVDQMNIDVSRKQALQKSLGEIAQRIGEGLESLDIQLVLMNLNLISQMAEYALEIELAALTDPLTDLSNKRAYEKLMNSAIRILQKPDNRVYFALVAYDLDRFKGINDDYGHDTGDAGLKAFGKLLREKSRFDHDPSREPRLNDVLMHCKQAGGIYGTASRNGGDEFMMILAVEADKSEEAEEKLTRGYERIQNETRVSYFEHRSQQFALVTSSGMHIIQRDDSAEQAYKAADAALTRDKRTKAERYDNAVKSLRERGINVEYVEEKRHETSESNATPDVA
ncbi:MAG: diguanylate cyclase [Alphaproteobacteria bacterium]|nr:diguanylate cyclase [Alphaproteobacteria bacterium]